MESKITSSFIPRDTITTRAARVGGGGSGLLDILVLVGIVLLVASLALGIGTFLYMQFLKSSTSSKIEQINRAKAAFEPTLIAELTRLDDRMKAGEDLLHKHIAPSTILHVLEDLTLETVSFSSLEFEATGPDTIVVSLAGLARSVNSIALQADLFGKHSAIASPIFSNITREESGVRFDVTATINPASIRYVNSVAVSQGQSPTELEDLRGAVPAQPQPQEPVAVPEDEEVPVFGGNGAQ